MSDVRINGGNTTTATLTVKESYPLPCNCPVIAQVSSYCGSSIPCWLHWTAQVFRVTRCTCVRLDLDSRFGCALDRATFVLQHVSGLACIIRDNRAAD